jgi:hypothetical protein
MSNMAAFHVANAVEQIQNRDEPKAEKPSSSRRAAPWDPD